MRWHSRCSMRCSRSRGEQGDGNEDQNTTQIGRTRIEQSQRSAEGSVNDQGWRNAESQRSAEGSVDGEGGSRRREPESQRGAQGAIIGEGGMSESGRPTVTLN